MPSRRSSTGIASSTASSQTSTARAFLDARLHGDHSVIFLALVDRVPVGFMQLYPTFSSVHMGRAWRLNDLFVAPDARRTGVGGALLRRAYDYARETGAVQLTLQTARDNLTAQATYEAGGWVRDLVFVTYTLNVLP